MIVKSFEIEREYPIKCKMFCPSHAGIKKVVLGVHGFAGDKESSMLFELAKSIEPSGGALVCFDLPAHGESPVDESKLTVENCISDVLSLAQWIGDAYPSAEKYIFATSFGGYISLLSSDKLKNYRMILRAPAVTMPRILLESSKITPEEFERKNVIVCGFERKIQLPYSFYESLTRYDPFAKEYSNDILVIHGSKDDVVPLADVESFVKNRENVKLFVIKDADHRFKKKGEIERIVHETMMFMNKTLD